MKPKAPSSYFVSLFFAVLTAFLSMPALAACEKNNWGTVNINNASSEAIAATLKGIGLQTAEKIVIFRIQNGPFLALDELLLVKGVGVKTLENNHCRIRLNDPVQLSK